MKKRKKVFKIILTIVGILAITIIINFVPTWDLETSDMSILSGAYINVYYENEEAAAKDVFVYADAETVNIAQKLGFNKKQNINVYIYDYQNTMQTKKYGFIASLLGLDWYIGDNIATNVLLTSPANPGNMHGYDDVKYVVLHEIVHAYISAINKGIDLWLTEGAALYLSNGEPFSKTKLDYFDIPTYKDICSNNPIYFSNCGGYTFAHTYIEYLHKEYGWDSVLMLIETENYEECFAKSKEEIYKEWVDFIRNYSS